MSRRKKRICYAMRRNKNGMGDVRCRKWAQHGLGGLCRSCYNRVKGGGDPCRTFLPWGRIKQRKALMELKSGGEPVQEKP